jgi:hypothetical protein
MVGRRRERNQMTYALHPWQSKLLTDFQAGGFKPGELMIISAGRQTGKSQITRYMADWQELMGEKYPYRKLTQSPVDGQMWYTIRCNSEVARWLRDNQDVNHCYEHIDPSWQVERNTFDVSETVYIQLGLKFS